MLNRWVLERRAARHQYWVVQRTSNGHRLGYWRGGTVGNGNRWTSNPRLACLYHDRTQAERDAGQSELARYATYVVTKLK